MLLELFLRLIRNECQGRSYLANIIFPVFTCLGNALLSKIMYGPEKLFSGFGSKNIWSVAYLDDWEEMKPFYCFPKGSWFPSPKKLLSFILAHKLKRPAIFFSRSHNQPALKIYQWFLSLGKNGFVDYLQCLNHLNFIWSDVHLQSFFFLLKRCRNSLISW